MGSIAKKVLASFQRLLSTFASSYLDTFSISSDGMKMKSDFISLEKADDFQGINHINREHRLLVLLENRNFQVKKVNQIIEILFLCSFEVLRASHLHVQKRRHFRKPMN